MIRQLIAFAMMMGVASHLCAETATWSPGRVIDVPLEITVKPDAIRSRTITLPGGSIQPIAGAWSKNDLEIDLVAHKVTLTLLSATLTTPVHVHDDLGNTFTLMVRPEPSRRLDPELIVEDARNVDSEAGARVTGGAVADGGAGRARLVDSHSEITRMYRVMMGAADEPDVRVHEILTRNDAGKVIAGEVVEDSDDMRITLLRAYSGPALTGYEALVEWKRDYPVSLNIQQLTITSPEARLVAIAASRSVIMPSSGPAATILEKGKGVRVFLLEEGGN